MEKWYILHSCRSISTTKHMLKFWESFLKLKKFQSWKCNYLFQDFQGQIQPASIIFVSGSKSRPTNFQILKKLFDSAQIHVFTISYPSTAFPDMVQLSTNNGKHYSIHDSASSMYTVTSLSQVFSDLLGEFFFLFFSFRK